MPENSHVYKYEDGKLQKIGIIKGEYRPAGKLMCTSCDVKVYRKLAYDYEWLFIGTKRNINKLIKQIIKAVKEIDVENQKDYNEPVATIAEETFTDMNKPEQNEVICALTQYSSSIIPIIKRLKV